MDWAFGKWNQGSGKAWLTVGTNNKNVTLTVEQARDLAIEILMRAWPRDNASVIIQKFMGQAES